MKPSLLTRIDQFLSKNPSLKGRPATTEEISAAEKELQVTLHSDYQAFIRHFGGAYAGIAIHGFSNGSSIGKETIIDLTRLNRKLANENGIFAELNQCYVIADDGAGNPLALDPEGKVLVFDYDTR